ncbi:MAG: GNAT family N-acetyltransferase [Candidatus Binataceae bacterium]|jgi:L-amino acid N-acyltransferase YncA
MIRTELASRYPKEIKLPDGRIATVRLMGSADKQALLEFARSLPEDDLLFLRLDITDPATIDEWIHHIEEGTTITLLAEMTNIETVLSEPSVKIKELAAYATLHMSNVRWTRKTAELRINIAPAYRGIGLGRRLTAEIFDVAKSVGLRKIVAQMTPDQTSARSVFEKLGFHVEAVLADWVEDRRGQSRDLLMMTYDLHGFSSHVNA